MLSSRVSNMLPLPPVFTWPPPQASAYPPSPELPTAVLLGHSGPLYQTPNISIVFIFIVCFRVCITTEVRHLLSSALYYHHGGPRDCTLSGLASGTSPNKSPVLVRHNNTSSSENGGFSVLPCPGQSLKKHLISIISCLAEQFRLITD